MTASLHSRTTAALDVRATRRFRPADLVVIVVNFSWLVVALLLRDPLYDLTAVAASSFSLAAATAFYRWDSPPASDSFRLVAFFVFAQTFSSSGLAVINEVKVLPSFALPTTEAFSFAVVSSTLFAATFVGGAWLTAPRRPPPEPPVEKGPIPPVAIALALVTMVVSVDFFLSTALDNVSRLGVLPLILFNLTTVSAMLIATRLLTPNRMTIPIGILILGQAVATFYSSMLMMVTFLLRDMILTYIFLKRRLPYALLGVMALTILLLNPVKMTFRSNRDDMRGGTQLTANHAAEFWAEGFESTWGSKSRGSEGASSAFETTSDRFNYNRYSAHVYSTVPSRYPFELGGTYEDIPMMFVPRILYPDKPLSATSTRSRWLIKLGLQTALGAETTAISLPTATEAYWNFGWAGIFGVPALLGMLVGAMIRFVPRDPVARAGYVMVIVIYMCVFIDMMVWIIPNIVIVAITGWIAPLYARIGRRRPAASTRPAATPPPPLAQDSP